jgi:hypothetical protein
MSDPEQELADRLAEETARLAARLAFAIEPHEARGHYALAAAPVAVLFERSLDPEVLPTHRSGRIDPSLLPFLVDVTQRARGRLAYGDERDNPYLIALVLACFYVIEGARSDALGLGRLAGRMPAVAVIAPEAADKDLEVRRGSTALRVIAPVEDDGGTEVVAAVELTWS